MQKPGKTSGKTKQVLHFLILFGHQEELATLAAKAVKRKSPSATRRNATRRAKFLKKKSEPLSSCTADITDVTLASQYGQPASAHKVVLSCSGPSSTTNQHT